MLNYKNCKKLYNFKNIYAIMNFIKQGRNLWDLLYF